MGQVPNVTAPAVKILVIGDGRLATTLWSVLQTKAKSTTSTPMLTERWSRRTPTTLRDLVSSFQPTHVWLAISDRAIASFAAEHAALFEARTVVHFAGSLSLINGVHAAHPLTTFASTVAMPEDEFNRVPFVLDLQGPELSTLMPGFWNRAFRLAPEERAYYHALCVMAGNFTTLLWETVAARFEETLTLPAEALSSYRDQTFKNLAHAQGRSVLTGPLVRGDSETIQAHHRALLEHFEMPLLKIYDGFADLYRTEST